MTGNNPDIDVANMNSYTCIKFGEISSIFSQDMERKRNYDINQGLYLFYKFEKIPT